VAVKKVVRDGDAVVVMVATEVAKVLELKLLMKVLEIVAVLMLVSTVHVMSLKLTIECHLSLLLLVSDHHW